MHHLVRFVSAEGRDGTHFCDTLEEAAAFVERLRNAEGATDVRLFRLTELPIEFKAYYHVQVQGVDMSAEAPVAMAPSPLAPSMSVRQTVPPSLPLGVVELNGHDGDVAPAVTESAAANGRRLFSRT